MVYDDLIHRLSDALERGDVDPARLEALLRRRRPARRRVDVASILRAAGALICFTGLGVLYALVFGGLPTWAQATTPYVFPAAALSAAILLHRRDRPEWEVELAGATGYVAFGLASATSAAVLGAGPGAGAAVSLVAAAIVAGLHRLVGIVRLTGWGLTASLVAFTGLASDAAGLLTSSSVPWWLIAQAVAAVPIGGLLLRRGSHAGAEAAWRSSSMLAIASAAAGIVSTRFDHLGPWHALLTIAVAASLVAASRFELPSLLWTGALGGLVWLVAMSVVVGSSIGWALAVIVFGAGLIAFATLVARRRDLGAASPAI
jgi:hypothetical protein